MPLTDTAVKQAKPKQKDYKLADAGGLFLLVKTNGAKYWRLKYRHLGKEKLLALGVYGGADGVSLAKARQKAAEAKLQLQNGVDPGEQRKQDKRAKLLDAENAFAAVAKEWWENARGRWSVDHADRVWLSLEADVLPYIGAKPINTLQPPDLIDVIRRVEKRGALDVAGRISQRIASVFRFAVQSHKVSINPARELSGILKTRKVRHQASLPRAELPELLQRLKQYDGQLVTILAMRLLMLTFVRPGELRGARWSEFDIDAKQWRIPAERMKMKTEHIVPLSKQAVAVLNELHPHTGRHDLLFPSERNRTKPISENTLTFALYRMGYKDRATPHGFRATASSILNEQGFNRDAIERQLAHQERNKVRGAYTHHAEYLKERGVLMQWWGDYLQALADGSNVVPANFRRA